MNIIGAGLSGLIAAHAWRNGIVVERSAQPQQTHKALLRFRGEQVSALTGIAFRRVVVRKAIFSQGKHCPLTIALANQYSRKVLGRTLNDRSIWSLAPVERFIAPENFYERLLEAVEKRVVWNCNADFCLNAQDRKDGWVSTAPLNVMLQRLGIAHDLEFYYAPIRVRRYRVPRCDVFQTIYFPDALCPIYRASITSDLLISESASEANAPALTDAQERTLLQNAFGVEDLEPIESASQRYGKIAPVHDGRRRAVLARLTTEHGLYTLGRFATWRNLLLDDLPHDISMINRLRDGDHYAARLSAV